MSDDAVVDSACLIGLERVGRLDILAHSFDSVFIPPAVRNELGRDIDWLIVRPVQNVGVLSALRTQIAEGESETIALAMELGDVLAVLDDKKARRIAQQVGLKLIGTVGLLLRAKRRGIITEVKPVLDALEAVDFRISAALYAEALRLAQET